jgi:hypothetical protein
MVIVCASGCEAAPVESPTFAPTLLAPTGLLDRVQAVRVEVFSGDAKCDASKGLVEGIDANTPRLARTTLTQAQCPQGRGRFCGALTLDLAAAPRTFVVTGDDADGQPFMRGCATQVVDKRDQELVITLVRALDAPVCGNGKLEPGEFCDTPNDGQCDAQCRTAEFIVSTGVAANGTSDSADKSSPSFAWGDGANTVFVAAYTDLSIGAGNQEVGVRFLGARLEPLTGTLGGGLFLPNDPAVNPPQPVSANQARPALARLADGTLLAVFEDTQGTTGKNIRARIFTGEGRASAAAAVNVAEGAGDQTLPAVAINKSGTALIVWEDNARIFGRTLTPPNVLGIEQELSGGGSNASPRVASTGAGWVVVWSSGGDIRQRTIGADGTPFGGDAIVNEVVDGVQEEPRIAALADGRYAIAWTDRRKANDADVVVQRFAANGRRIAGDQTTAWQDAPAGDQSGVAIAGMSAVAGSYALAWLDASSGQVRARYIGGDGGMLLNPVDGTESDFQVSIATGVARNDLVIAAGGALPSVAFGWNARSVTTGNIFLRRVPPPTR